MTASRLFPIAALLFGFAQPVLGQDVAYTQPPRLQNRAEIEARVDSITVQLSDRAVSSTTLVWAKVRVDGSTSDVSVRESSHDTIRDNLAVGIVRTIRWTAAKNSAGPIDTWIAIPVVLPKRGSHHK